MRKRLFGLTFLAAAWMAGCPDEGGIAILGDTTPDVSADAVEDAADVEPGDAVEEARPDVAIPDGAICAPGHSQCIGSNFMTCNAQGSDWMVVVCEKGTTCTATGCAEKACSPNQAKCDDAGKVVVCKPDGTAWGAPTACADDQVCKGGQCLPKACAEGTTKCTTTAVIACKDGAWVETPCGTNEVCFQGDCVECFDDTHCPSGQGLACVAGHCVKPPLKVKTDELPDGQINAAYTATLEAVGGDGAYTWSSGALPAGLALDAAGTLSGTPTAPGTTTATFTVKDGGGAEASKDLDIVIHGAGLTITSKSPLPDGEDGTDYSFQFKALGGLEPYGWMVLKGALPAGLTLGSNGLVSGIPNDHGTFPFTVRVVDAADPIASAKGDFQITIKIAPLNIVGDQMYDLLGFVKIVILPMITVVEGIPIPYNQQLQAKGGLKPYHWAESELSGLIAGFIPKAGVPDGLTLSDSGKLSGSVTKTDSVVELKIPFVNFTLTGFFFMAQVTDSQDPADSDQGLFLIPTVPVDLGGLGGLGL
jgi:hypothetical protein